MTDVLVLCYHAVSERWHEHLATSPSQMEHQLRFLAQRGYRWTTFAEAISGSTAGPSVAVTFDDGYRSIVRLALPILQRLGVPATAFLPTDFIDADGPMSWPGIDHWAAGPHRDELVPMSWEEVRELVAAGWEIGAHTCSHRRLTELSDEELQAELADSKAICSRQSGVECQTLAYPFGDYDRRIIGAARRAGYIGAATLPTRLHAPEPLAWPRIHVQSSDGPIRFRAKVSRRVRALRRTYAWTMLDVSRQALRVPRS